MSPDTTIVGGGIAGLATALSLAQAGRRVRVLEQAPRFTEIGAGLQVGPNASRAMDRLGVLGPVRDKAVLPRRGLLLDAITGETLTVLDLGAAFVRRFGYPYLVVHRSDVLDALLHACREHPFVELYNGKLVSEAEIDSTGGVLTCEDGSTFSSRAVVGADGLQSRLRRVLVDDELVGTGFAAYRGTMPVSQAPDGVNVDDVLIWIGPGMHLVQYPVRRGEIFNQVAVFKSDRFAAGEHSWGGPEELDARFSVACDNVRAAVALVGRDQRWPMYDREPLTTWIRDRLLLVGDAAHPMLQYLGQGACQALEDAVELGTQFVIHGDDVDEAFRSFEQVRLERASRCQRSARPWGEVWHSDDPVVVGLRNRVFRLRAAQDYDELDWLYGDHLTSLEATGGEVKA